MCSQSTVQNYFNISIALVLTAKKDAVDLVRNAVESWSVSGHGQLTPPFIYKCNFITSHIVQSVQSSKFETHCSLGNVIQYGANEETGFEWN